jgi:hypothetical protein
LELPPPEKKLKKSQCTPLFMCAYTGTKWVICSFFYIPSLKAQKKIQWPVPLHITLTFILLMFLS